MFSPQNRSMRKCICIVVSSFLMLSCGGLNAKRANQLFLERHPTYMIISSLPGEGWDDVVYYHFEFRKPSEQMIYKEIWGFVKQPDGNWKATSIERVPTQNVPSPSPSGRGEEKKIPGA
jgi:hypothetical protein